VAFAITSFSEAPFASDSSDVIAYAQGISITSSIGEESNVIDVSLSVTGSQATITNAGAVGGSSVLVVVSGSELSSSVGEETINIIVGVTSSELSISNKTATQDTLTAFGEAPFATQSPSTFDIESVTVATTTGAGTLPSFLLQTSLGTFSVSANGTISVVVTEHTLNTSVGSTSIVGHANVSVTGSQMTMTLGEESAFTSFTAEVTGSQLTSSIGEETPTGNAIASLTGIQLTSSLGTAEQESKYDVTGIQMSMSVGSITMTGDAVVDLTGIQLQTNTGSPNITAWAEIDPGVSNVWTEVDLAA
jgi:hypothetical protein